MRIAELEGSELFLLPPLMRCDPCVRDLFVSSEVQMAVCPPWPENHDGTRRLRFRADLDAFTRHDEISVSEHPFEKPWDTHLARIHPVEKEVWDIRSLEPPGTRCFGRFGGQNLFVALTWAYREDVESGDDWCRDDDWGAEIRKFEKEWERLFKGIPLFRGDTLDDYLTNYFAV